MSSESQLRRRAAAALSVPLIEFLGISPANEEEPTSGLSLVPEGNALNALGALHAGALSTLLELAA